MAELGAFFSQFDFRPLVVSLKTSVVAAIFVFTLGILAAWWTLGVSDRVKGWFDSIFTLPMVLPPTVVGFFLLVIFGKSTPIGRFFIDHGLRLIFSWPATVIAAAVVAFPLMYRTTRAAFEQIDHNMLDAARTLGFSEWKVFYKIMLPLSWPGVAAGTMLSFARGLGEFGATLFVAGNLPGVTQTMPIAVYFAWAGGDMVTAGVWVALIVVFSFAAVFGINAYAARANRYKEAESAA
ncbi:MAG: molybdate ABC transporter permease subunit [Coriobacteriia bacterium]